MARDVPPAIDAGTLPAFADDLLLPATAMTIRLLHRRLPPCRKPVGRPRPCDDRAAAAASELVRAAPPAPHATQIALGAADVPMLAGRFGEAAALLCQVVASPRDRSRDMCPACWRERPRTAPPAAPRRWSPSPTTGAGAT